MELIYINGYVSDYEDAKTVFAQNGWLFNKISNSHFDGAGNILTSD
jgi:hypothetical protein